MMVKSLLVRFARRTEVPKSPLADRGRRSRNPFY